MQAGDSILLYHQRHVALLGGDITAAPSETQPPISMVPVLVQRPAGSPSYHRVAELTRLHVGSDWALLDE